jgi:hypothetical protein
MAKNPPIGVDGWPLDATDPDPALQRKRFQRTMRSLQARWRAGDCTALAAAIRECWLRGEVPEEWLVEATADVVRLAMSEHEQRSRNDWDRHKARWEALVELRERRYELLGRFNDDRGISLERARGAVSDILKQTDAAGSPEAIKQSYEIVEAAGGADATYLRYKALLQRRREI